MAKAFDAIAKRIIAATGSTRGQGLHRQAVATEESLAPLAAVVFLEGNAVGSRVVPGGPDEFANAGSGQHALAVDDAFAKQQVTDARQSIRRDAQATLRREQRAVPARPPLAEIAVTLA